MQIDMIEDGEIVWSGEFVKFISDNEFSEREADHILNDLYFNGSSDVSGYVGHVATIKVQS